MKNWIEESKQEKTKHILNMPFIDIVLGWQPQSLRQISSNFRSVSVDTKHVRENVCSFAI